MAQDLRIQQGAPQRDTRGQQVERTRPAMPVVSPFDEIDRLFDELLPMPLLRRGWSPLSRGLFGAQARVPSVDLIEHDDDVVLRAEVPGLRKEDLEITVDESSVTLRGVLARETKDADGHYYRREITHGEFVRSVALPAAVDTDKTKAALKDGVLELVMPKLDTAKRRKIQIK